MRILHVYRTYFPDTFGGLEQVIRQICSGTGALGIENRIFALSPEPLPSRIVHDGTEVYRFKRTFELASCGIGVGSFSGFRDLAEWADIIHYNFPWPFADVLDFALRKDVLRVVSYHSDIVRQRYLFSLYRPLMQAFLERCNAIVATSENYLSTSPVLQSFSSKVRVIPIGIDEESYPEVDDRIASDIIGRFGKGYFLFVGVLRYYKGLHVLLEALQGSPVRCLIAGGGPLESMLWAKAGDLRLENVEFLGPVTEEEKVALMRNCKAVVFPSHMRSEAYGVTLLEGAMFGKPMISCEIGTGTSYVNLHGVSGLVVVPNDAGALKAAMLKLHKNDGLAERMGLAARERYLSEFTSEMMSRRYVSLYQGLLEERSSACLL